ncbi:very short patch repair endonuclease [Paracoccus sp. ME4]|uniref:very short patch repair endonuclease n=1 Tax=Paracoccus sp. ME4 TaxID=3138066 RepID=UPI00398A8B92
MTDVMDRQTRSKAMAKIRGRDTKPELLVRRSLHAMGFRFRLNERKLPGSPDIVLTKWRTAIFVHGCFWHRHHSCRKATTPSTNVDFWAAKFEANMARDQRALDALAALGWRTAVVWECALQPPGARTALDGLADFIRDGATDRVDISGTGAG